MKNVPKIQILLKYKCSDSDIENLKKMINLRKSMMRKMINKTNLVQNLKVHILWEQSWADEDDENKLNSLTKNIHSILSLFSNIKKLQIEINLDLHSLYKKYMHLRALEILLDNARFKHINIEFNCNLKLDDFLPIQLEKGQFNTAIDNLSQLLIKSIHIENMNSNAVVDFLHALSVHPNTITKMEEIHIVVFSMINEENACFSIEFIQIVRFLQTIPKIQRLYLDFTQKIFNIDNSSDLEVNRSMSTQDSEINEIEDYSDYEENLMTEDLRLPIFCEPEDTKTELGLTKLRNKNFSVNYGFENFRMGNVEAMFIGRNIDEASLNLIYKLFDKSKVKYFGY